MHSKYVSLILGVILGIPAFFNDKFAGYLFNLFSSWGLNNINIFVYPLLVLILSLPIFLCINYILNRSYKEQHHFIKNLCFNIIGFFIAYFIYMIFAISSLGNLVGGL